MPGRCTDCHCPLRRTSGSWNVYVRCGGCARDFERWLQCGRSVKRPDADERVRRYAELAARALPLFDPATLGADR